MHMKYNRGILCFFATILIFNLWNEIFIPLIVSGRLYYIVMYTYLHVIVYATKGKVVPIYMFKIDLHKLSIYLSYQVFL